MNHPVSDELALIRLLTLLFKRYSTSAMNPYFLTLTFAAFHSLLSASDIPTAADRLASPEKILFVEGVTKVLVSGLSGSSCV